MILVTPLSQIDQTIRLYRPSHLVTLLSPEHMIDTPLGIVADRHLRLAMNDVPDPEGSEAPPCERHIRDLVAFGRDWQAEAPMLVHCWAGISRSTAAAYILLCDRFGEGSEHDIARALRYRAPHAFPNALMIRLADAMLARGGRMIAAVAGIGRGRIVAEGERVELPIQRVDL